MTGAKWKKKKKPVGPAGEKVRRPPRAPLPPLAVDPARRPDVLAEWHLNLALEGCPRWHLWIPDDAPRTKGNSYRAFVVKGRAVVTQDREAKHYASELRKALEAKALEAKAEVIAVERVSLALPLPLRGPVRLDVVAVLPLTDAARRKGGDWVTRALAGDPACAPGAQGRDGTADRGNLLKQIEDAASGVLYEDDRQVIEGDVRKVWGRQGGWHLRLVALRGHDGGLAT